MKRPHKDDQTLFATLWSPRYAYDPLAFVMVAYPWGEKGTPLAGFKGPRRWQRKRLEQIRDHIKTQHDRIAKGEPPEAMKRAVASGRGIGKSALVAWICHWMLSCHPGSTTVVAANSEDQLSSVTFPEINKWITMGINAHWFESQHLFVGPAKWYAENLRQVGRDPEYYYVEGKLWSEERPAAFAGPHSSVGMLLVFDEASGIPESIWGVALGYLTDLTPYRFWFAFSNPRNNSGGFYERFTNPKHAASWQPEQIDARTVEGVDRKFYDDLISVYGIDDDVVRVEVLGQFPNTGSRQFIPNYIVASARERALIVDAGAPLIMGVDIARDGKDHTVIRFRQGYDARSIRAVRFRIPDLYAIADRIASLIDEHRPDAVNIDYGMGAGVGDILRRHKYRVNIVNFGTKPEDEAWANRGTELYALMRDWLREGGCIDDSSDLYGDLVGRDYEFWGVAKDRIKLEDKEKFRLRARRSPDDGDALALTFASRVARRDLRIGQHAHRPRTASGLDYRVLG